MVVLESLNVDCSLTSPIMSSASGSYPFVLHTTPPLGGLPASDPESVYLASAFQLAAPGRFALQTADWGDNGGMSSE